MYNCISKKWHLFQLVLKNQVLLLWHNINWACQYYFYITVTQTVLYIELTDIHFRLYTSSTISIWYWHSCSCRFIEEILPWVTWSFIYRWAVHELCTSTRYVILLLRIKHWLLCIWLALADPEAREQSLVTLLHSLPTVNFKTAVFLFKHLRKLVVLIHSGIV